MTLAFNSAPVARSGAKPTPVYFPFLDVKPEDGQSEAQLFRTKACASGYAYIETTGNPDVNGKYIVGTGTPLTAYVNRLYVASCYTYGNLWNINPNADTIIFTVGATTYTATLVDGSYPAGTLYSVILTALNAAGSPVTFSYVLSPQSSFSYIFTGTSAFQIIGGNMTGRPFLANVPLMSAPDTTFTLWNVLGLYTRWIDINSEVLTSYSKIKNSATSQVSPTNFYRLYLPSTSASNSNIIDIPIRTPAVSYLSTLSTSSIDLTLLDEFGDPLYLHPGSNFSLILNLILEQ